MSKATGFFVGLALVLIIVNSIVSLAEDLRLKNRVSELETKQLMDHEGIKSAVDLSIENQNRIDKIGDVDVLRFEIRRAKENIAKNEGNMENAAKLLLMHEADIVLLKGEINKLKAESALMIGNADRIDLLEEKYEAFLVGSDNFALETGQRIENLSSRMDKLEELHTKCFKCHKECKENK